VGPAALPESRLAVDRHFSINTATTGQKAKITAEGTFQGRRQPGSSQLKAEGTEQVESFSVSRGSAGVNTWSLH